MTIEQKAREIALMVAEDGGVSWSQEPYAAARLGIIEGQRMAAVEINALKDALAQAEGEIAELRALIEEQKL